MMGAKMSLVPEFPRPHHKQLNWSMGVETAVANRHTIVPIINYDEGLGVINAYESNPSNALFAEYAGSNCYPTSRINKIFCQAEFTLVKGSLVTDKQAGVKFATMMIHSAFNETGLANDEVSTIDLNEVLELQVEATDRQMYPLYNTVDLLDGKANSQLDMGADQPGLDTDLEIEGIAFDVDQFYKTLAYHTTRKKLRSVCSGLQWHTLTQQHPTKIVRFHQFANTKFMNPYAFLGLYIGCSQISNTYQIGVPGDVTDIPHMNVQVGYRYNEFNHEFNHSLQ